MNTYSKIESTLTKTPQPEPRSGLLSELERQIVLSSPNNDDRINRIEGILSRWRKAWFPAMSCAGVAAALIILFIIITAPNSRSLADSVRKFSELRTVRMVTYQRSGPAVHVWVDRSKAQNVSPNYSTSQHPQNPLLKEETWFRRDPQDVSLWEAVLLGAKETVWTRRNRELRIDNKTGARIFRLNPAHPNIEQMTRPLRDLEQREFREITPPQAPHQEFPSNCWVGELRLEGSTINGRKKDDLIVRVWLDNETGLARRVELLNYDYIDKSKLWILQAWEFHDFNQPVPSKIFDFTITEQDAAQFGTTVSALERLSDKAMTIELKGEQGAEVEGTIKDDRGESDVEGTLPFTFVHDPKGKTEMEFRMKDGVSRSFGVSGNGMGMHTTAARLVATIEADGKFSFSSKNN